MDNIIECTLDLETRSRLNLKLVGAIEYAKHESTSVFCVGYMINDDAPKLWIPERGPMPEALWHAFQHAQLVAHNAGFEAAVTRYTLTRYETLTDAQKLFLSQIQPGRWRCTAVKAAACSLPRDLEGACDALELPVKKDMEGNRLIKKFMKPRKPSKNNPAEWWDDRDELRHIYRYCLTDVKAERLLDKALPNLTAQEQEMWELDQVINARGVLFDIPTVRIILGMIAEEQGNITREVRKLSSGAIQSVSQGAKLLAWLNERGAEMKNLQAPTIKDKLLEDDLHPDVRTMLEYRQGGSKTSTAKYVKMLHAVGDDHRARELLLFNGAIPTGRWAGRRIQPQNFPRPTIRDFNSDEAIALIQSKGLEGIREKYGKTKVMDVLVSTLRGMIIASPGHELFCADFAAIELHLAFWVAEYEAGLEAIRQKRKMYEEMAEAIFGIPWNEISKESIERFIGKETMLGAQYGMGFKKFLMGLHNKGKKEITPEMAKKAINTYRKVHWPIPQMWNNLERAAVYCIQNPMKVVKLHKVAMRYDGKLFFEIKLPSGRKLRYPKPRLSMKQTSYGKLVPAIHYWTTHDKYGWIETTMWGGIITNHIVQGIARDLMAHGMTQIEDASYKFLLSIHDESLAERKIGEGSLEEFIKLMAGCPPDWAKDIPVKAEGWVGVRYHK